MRERKSGILLHITSLPGGFGTGDLGPSAFRFADFLDRAGQKLWQILPLTPTLIERNNSPYNSLSAFAGNPLLLSPDMLVQQGWLRRQDVEDAPSFAGGRADYARAAAFKRHILHLAWERNRSRLQGDAAFGRFLHEHACWLDDYALFMSIRRHFGGRPWHEWPRELKYRHPGALASWRDRLRDSVQEEAFGQFLFYTQWEALRMYCNERGIMVTGDMPIYVDHDSADVWARPHLFKLDGEMNPTALAGVPPDYFSETGQLWENPVYDWPAHAASGYEWWFMRMEHSLRMFDIVRIDHFRGLVAYWEVPATEETALAGRWVEAPAMEFFSRLKARFGELPIIAEDLGTITPDVREVMTRFGFPGMKLLLFAFSSSDPSHPYLPHNFDHGCWVYTGTHDNNTAVGWFRNEADEYERDRLRRYVGRKVSSRTVHTELIRLAMSSVAEACIIPMQDVLGLGEKARMNRPSTTKGNWQWRLTPSQLSDDVAERLAGMTFTYGR